MTMSISKNTMVGMSVGTITAIIAAGWIGLGIGRPLFASDLVVIEESIERLDKKTSVAILNLGKQSLETELRGAKRELRKDPDNDNIGDDIDEIEGEIEDIDAKIICYRTVDCEMEDDV
ncbi:MAG: hypothetical protein O7D34_02190 [Ignavibacteria bacterium]|nr:hypothetical protein [Ignavibacteria bacterium]